MTQRPNSNVPNDSQAKRWSDAELRRVSRAIELLIKVDKRLKEGTSNGQTQNPKDTQVTS